MISPRLNDGNQWLQEVPMSNFSKQNTLIALTTHVKYDNYDQNIDCRGRNGSICISLEKNNVLFCTHCVVINNIAFTTTQHT